MNPALLFVVESAPRIVGGWRRRKQRSKRVWKCVFVRSAAVEEPCARTQGGAGGHEGSGFNGGVLFFKVAVRGCRQTEFLRTTAEHAHDEKAHRGSVQTCGVRHVVAPILRSVVVRVHM